MFSKENLSKITCPCRVFVCCFNSALWRCCFSISVPAILLLLPTSTPSSRLSPPVTRSSCGKLVDWATNTRLLQDLLFRAGLTCVGSPFSVKYSFILSVSEWNQQNVHCILTNCHSREGFCVQSCAPIFLAATCSLTEDDEMMSQAEKLNCYYSMVPQWWTLSSSVTPIIAQHPHAVIPITYLLVLQTCHYVDVMCFPSWFVLI